MGIETALGVGASVAGGIASGKGAKKAAKIQAQAAREQQAFAQNIYDKNAERYTPDIAYGNKAGTQIASLLGLGGNGTTPDSNLNAANDAFNNWRNSTGYKFNLDQGLNAVNSNAYAGGYGNSGATMKALQDRGTQVGNQYFNDYLSQLGGVQAVGSGAKGALAGAGQNLVNSQAAASNKSSDARSYNSMYQGQLIGNTAKDLSKVFGSSFG